jgi:hypothetical protein
VNSQGNRWYFFFSTKDAQPRTEELVVRLYELAPLGKTYSFTWPIRVVPLYNISISPLTFELLDDADKVGKSECQIRWVTPEGNVTERNHSLRAGDRVRFLDFAREFVEVSTTSDLYKPLFRWTERDTGAGFNPPLTWTPILPGHHGTHLIEEIIAEDGDGFDGGSDARARFAYYLTIKLRIYHPSEL